jgi:hypothetical protein
MFKMPTFGVIKRVFNTTTTTRGPMSCRDCRSLPVIGLRGEL